MTPSPLINTLQNALKRSGVELDGLEPAELAGFDQIHVRGKRASLELAELLRGALAGIESPRILDLGCGVGGTSRLLAGELNARVDGLDLSAEFVELANFINRSLNLAEQVRCQQGDACATPYPDARFDAVVLQHVSMCIADKARLFGEIRRLLKPAGVLVLQEVVAGPNAPAHYPTPWARTAEASFLQPPLQLLQLLQQAGFDTLEFRDRTQQSQRWFERQGSRPAPTDGLHIGLLLGADSAQQLDNQRRNFNEQRIGVVEALLRRL